jgi:hypothetical protein
VGCDDYAKWLTGQIGGTIHTFRPPAPGFVFPADAYDLGPDEAWVHHTVVVLDGLVYDQYADGMPVDEWKAHWGTLRDVIDFGF